MIKLSREVKIGLIMISSLTIFLFGLNYLKGNSLITSRRNYYAIYSKVDGLKESNPINVNGFKVGSVTRIELMPDNSGRLKVTLSFTDGNIKVTEGCLAKIVSSDLLGSKAIEFIPGKSDKELEKGSVLPSEIQLSLTEVLEEQIDPVKAKFVTLMTSLDSVLGGIQHVLNDKTVGDINQSFTDVKKTLNNLASITSELDQLIAEQHNNIGGTMENLNTVSGTLAKSSQSIERIVRNIESLTDTVNQQNISQTLSNARKSVESTNALLARINAGEGSLGKLVNTDSLHQQMVGTTKALEELFNDIQAHPSRYVSFSVFGRKEKGMKLTKDEEIRLRLLLNNAKK